MKKTIDLFCDIVDNYGDIGVVYRLGKELYNRNYKVRIFVNKLNEVSKIIKGFNSSLPYQVHNGIEFFDFNNFLVKVALNSKIVLSASFYLKLLNHFILVFVFYFQKFIKIFKK